MNILKEDNNIITKSPKETQKLAYKLGKSLKKGDVVGLVGELGAGKTCFVGGLMDALGISDKYRASSPTFILINEYKGKFPIYHFDMYRLNNITETYDLGIEEYFFGEGVSIVEWADRIEELLPENCIRINMEILGVNERKIVIKK